MQSLFFKKRQNYPSLENLLPQDNKMRAVSTQILDVQIYLFQGYHFLILVSSLWSHHLRPLVINLGEINNALVDQPHCIAFWVDHRMKEHSLTLILAVFSMPNMSFTSKSLLFSSLSSGHHPYPQQKLLPTEYHHCFSQSTNLGSWELSQIPLSASTLDQGSHTHYLNISAPRCLNFFALMKVQPRNSHLEDSGLQILKGARPSCLRFTTIDVNKHMEGEMRMASNSQTVCS